MHNEEFCGEVPEDTGSHPRHCLHQRKDDQICCWCGDLFLDDGPSEHGEYAPELPGPAK
jgi:hypothetical protein